MAESKEFIKLLDDIRDLHKRKNDGYAGKDAEDPWANFRMAEMLGISAFQGCLVRMSDKFIRVCNLSKDPTNDQVGEAITDTLMDLAVYSLIAICLHEEQNYAENNKLSYHFATLMDIDLANAAFKKAMEDYETMYDVLKEENENTSSPQITETEKLAAKPANSGLTPSEMDRLIYYLKSLKKDGVFDFSEVMEKIHGSSD